MKSTTEFVGHGDRPRLSRGYLRRVGERPAIAQASYFRDLNNFPPSPRLQHPILFDPLGPAGCFPLPIATPCYLGLKLGLQEKQWIVRWSSRHRTNPTPKPLLPCRWRDQGRGSPTCARFLGKWRGEFRKNSKEVSGAVSILKL